MLEVKTYGFVFAFPISEEAISLTTILDCILGD
jgi:hypothetical protein